ncbi:MAG: recombinase family protein [Thermaerobacter sp.]|nr:recombinase family protein [Thermaerobacter sp.]
MVRVNIRVAIYARVSKEEQAAEGLSLGAQEERCRAFTTAKDWQVAEVYVDGGYSGKNLQRPAMQRLLADADAHKWDIVLVWKLDRLSRRQKDVLTLLEDVLTPKGIGLQSATEPFETSTPMGKAMLSMLAVFAQLERETIIERTKLGRQASFEMGRWQGGRIPWGYQHTGRRGELEPDPTTAVHVRDIFARAAKGEGPANLAHYLQDRGIPAPRGDIWYARIVWGILRSPIYRGLARMGGETREAPHPALVDEETWDAVQRHMAQRAMGPRKDRPEFLVDGLLSCHECGEYIRGYKARNEGLKPAKYDDPVGRYRYYYVCARKRRQIHNRPLRAEQAPCHSRMWRQKGIDQQVDDAIRSWHTDPDVLDAALAEEFGTAPAPTDDPRIALEAELKALQGRIQRWYDAYESGAIDVDGLRRRVDRLLQAQADLEARLAGLPVADAVRLELDDRETVRRKLLDLAGYWESLDPLARQSFLRELGVTGIISPEGRVILRLADAP